MCYYRPQTKLGQGYVFTGICDSVNGGEGVPHTPRVDTPPGAADTPPSRHPPPWSRHHPPPHACCEIRSTRGWYASYCNAILFKTF